MKIPVTINNETFNLDEAQVATLRKALGINQRKLSDVPVGETFKLGDMKFIVLEHKANETVAILKDCWKTCKFDDKTNNYANSQVRTDMHSEFYNKVAAICGKENIVDRTVNLIADDVRTEYGVITDKVSLLTCDEYRKYVYIFDQYRFKSLMSWWWLATPHSTKANGYNDTVCCVTYDGALDSLPSSAKGVGVRPVLNFVSSIFVS